MDIVNNFTSMIKYVKQSHLTHILRMCQVRFCAHIILYSSTSTRNGKSSFENVRVKINPPLLTPYKKKSNFITILKFFQAHSSFNHSILNIFANIPTTPSYYG